MTYNGWTNYETWNAALWLDNDYFIFNYDASKRQNFWGFLRKNPK